MDRHGRPVRNYRITVMGWTAPREIVARILSALNMVEDIRNP
jgi:hypothetical protein